VARTRNVDPELGRLRGKLAVSVREGDTEAADLARQELHEANIRAAAKKLAAQLAAKPISPETVERVRAALFGGA
jgi:hypothetical protein